MTSNVLPSEGILSHTKGRIGEIYLESLCLSQSYTCQPCKGTQFDSLGIDYQLINFPPGEKKNNKLEQTKLILIQVKGTSISSSSMFEERDDHFLYTLSKSVYRAAGIRTLVVVVCAPEEEQYTNWITIDPDKILMFAKAYYYEVPEGGIETRKRIKIPKTNVLNKDQLKKLFD